MHLRVGPVVVAVAALVVAGCSSSSGSHGSLEVRPVIMPAQHTTQARPNPFASLRVPTSEAAYERLSRAQQAALAAALRSVNCAHPPTLAGDTRVVCSHESYAYLVGAPIFTADDVTKATPIPPDDTTPQWSIDLLLGSGGADRAYAWTSRHQMPGQTGVFAVEQRSSKAPCGLFTRTPCSDFLAFISDDVVVAVPPTFNSVSRTVLVRGAFDERSATRLAHQIAG